MTDHITTVGELITALQRYDRATPVRCATQPGYPLEYPLGRVVCTPDDAEGDGTPSTDPPVVWLGVGEHVGYRPGLATDAPRVVLMTPTTRGELAPGLAERAVRAARAYRTTDPDGFHRRHDNPEEWNRWARRARVARTIAATLDVSVDSVLVSDDPHRTYRTRNGDVPGDLITVTDGLTAHVWRFIPDFTTPGDGWLLLDHCPDCEAEIPATRIATLADLGEYLDGDIWAADEAHDESLHQPGCAFAVPEAEIVIPASSRTTAR